MTTASKPTDAVEAIWSELPADKWLSEAEMFDALRSTRIGGWYRDDEEMLRAIRDGWLIGGRWLHVRKVTDEIVGKVKTGPNAGRLMTRAVYEYRRADASDMAHLVDRKNAEQFAAEAAKAANAPLEAAIERVLAQRAAAAV